MLMATMLARMPDLRRHVQAVHVPDHRGICRDCRDDTPWPCEVSRIAAEAERHDAGARNTGLPWVAPTPTQPSFI
jgi:hypothetical protein